MHIRAINPATGELLCEHLPLTKNEVKSVVGRAKETFIDWRRLSFDERAKHFIKLSELLLENKDELARIMAQEMGKPIAQGRAEVEKSANVCRYYAQTAEDFLKDEPLEMDNSESFVTYQPMGVVLAIMPWNFPFWQVLRAAAPALMAGNVMLLKPAPNVPNSAIVLQKLFADAGFPEGALSLLFVDVGIISNLIKSPDVQAVTMTASSVAGKDVAANCGKHMKKCVMELGGNDPYIILEDADLVHAAKLCAQSRMINGGQSCIAAKRFIVVESVLEEFEKLFGDELKKYSMGDPMEEETLLGPLARVDLRNKLDDQVMRSISKGAEIVFGGELPDGKGAYYPVTLLRDVGPGMPAYEEELFGPVAAIISVKDEADAIRVANDSVFGLGGAVFTRDVERGRRIARDEIEVGSCFVNDFVKSDPRIPFGGIKESGYGRELGSFGIREFVNIKTVAVL